MSIQSRLWPVAAAIMIWLAAAFLLLLVGLPLAGLVFGGQFGLMLGILAIPGIAIEVLTGALITLPCLGIFLLLRAADQTRDPGVNPILGGLVAYVTIALGHAMNPVLGETAIIRTAVVASAICGAFIAIWAQHRRQRASP